MNQAGARGMRPGRSEREVLWFDLPSGGTEYERSWVARLPETEVVRLGELDAGDPDADGPSARPLTSFVARRNRRWSPGADRRWVASVGLHSDLTAQAGRLRQRGGVHHLVIAWDSDPALPVHALGPRAEAWRSARESDLVVCLSDVTRGRLLNAGVDPERVCVVRPGVDTRRFAPAPTGTPDEDPVVVFADPLTRGHGIRMVLEAWRVVHGGVPQARLRVLGDGPLRPVVQQAVASGIGVEHVTTSGDDAPAAQFRAGTVYVAAPQVGAARTAASRVRLLQAQASALPIVTTRTGGDHLFVADPPNDLVAQDVGHLAERLIWWLSHPTHAAQVGAYNRKRMIRDHEASVQLDLLAQAMSRAEESRQSGPSSLQDQRSRDELAAQR